LNYIDTESEIGTKESVKGYLYHLDGVYHFMPGQKLVPYLAAGLGGITLDPDNSGKTSDVLLNYGGGVKYYLKDNLALRGDVRHIVTVDDSENNLIYTVGLTFLFGGSRPVQTQAVVKVVDSDGDGVEDKIDKCPDTPKGVAVDASGCPTDTDEDGVPDYRDKCPHTSKGVMVDEDGCVLKYTLHIEFDFDKSDIRPVYHDNLQEAAEFIKHYEAPQILVAGHTDEIGTLEYNQKLSLGRAASVSKYLEENFEISGNRLAERGYGKTRPLTDDHSEAGRQKNRRVEIICCTIMSEK
jgi:OOP family OmpA-OmpF porin